MGVVRVLKAFLEKFEPMPQKTERIVHILVNEIIPFFGIPEALLSDLRDKLIFTPDKGCLQAARSQEAEYHSLPPAVRWHGGTVQPNVEIYPPQHLEYSGIVTFWVYSGPTVTPPTRVLERSLHS